MTSNQTERQNDQKTPLIRTVYDFVELFVISICIVFVIFSFAFRLCRVNGPSMEQTLYNGEMLLVSDLFYEPAQGDVVVFHQTSGANARYNELIVKRVIAVEGQFVKVVRDGVYVSDDAVFEESDRIDELSYAYMDVGYMLNYYNALDKVFEVPENCLFVMGDNRNHSADSRDPDIGFVDTRRIVGKVFLRLTPFTRMGAVN